MLINIQDDIKRLHYNKLLDGLLADKTTKKNIMWATDAYSSYGAEYQRDKEMQTRLLTGWNGEIIQPRALKAMAQQSERTRQHAEVFTPKWICAKMNNYADMVWFGQEDVFFHDGIPTEHIEFPEGKTWQQYVDSCRLEITCGEAPYLMSRYDVVTGEAIPIPERIGILDRKLRVVTENTSTEEEWLHWARRAFEATYGYEFQGDNLLIARINFVSTFEEYLQNQWHRTPTPTEYSNIARIAVWNLWQMDGLSYTIPYSKAEEETYQYNIMTDLLGLPILQAEPEKQPYCHIYDWRSKTDLEFRSLRKGAWVR